MDERFTKEALEALDGKVLPITIDNGDGTKRTVGVGTLKFEEGSLRMTGEIVDPAVAAIFKHDPAFKFEKEKDDGG